MQPDRERIEHLSVETGFRNNALEKVIRLTDILNDIFKHPFLSDVFVLKGGTALNLFFGPPSRLSVDLDFNYIGSTDRAEMLNNRERVENTVASICKSSGYLVQKSAYAHAGRKFYLGFVNIDGICDRIEVDINYLHRQLLLPYCTRSAWTADNSQNCSGKLISIEELCAGKICACFDRTSPRDIYDVVKLPLIAGRNWSSSIMRSIIIAYTGLLPKPVSDYSIEIVMRRLTREHFLKTLIPMLLVDDHPEFDSLRSEAWKILESFTILNDNEQEFVNRLQRGELLPELLFPDNKRLQELMRTHPPLLWKVQNAREHFR